MSQSKSNRQDKHTMKKDHSSKDHDTTINEKVVASFDMMGKSFQLLANKISDDKRQRHFNVIIVQLASAAVMLLSIGVSSYWTFRQVSIMNQNQVHQLNQQKINVLSKESQQLQENINYMYAVSKPLMYAATNIRSIRDLGRKHCMNGKYTAPDIISYNQKLFSSDTRLIGASYFAGDVFNDTVNQNILSFDSLVDVDKHPVCANNSASDTKLRKQEEILNYSIAEEINGLRDKEKLINHKISSTRAY